MLHFVSSFFLAGRDAEVKLPKIDGAFFSSVFTFLGFTH